MQYLDRIPDLMLSPAFVAALALAIALLAASRRSPLVPWGTFGAVMFAASLNKYSDEWIQEPPPFVGPLQALVNLGRPITIAGLLLLLLMGYRAAGPRRGVPVLIYGLMLAHLVLAAKILAYGDMGFGLLVLVTLAVNALLFVQVAQAWMKSAEDVDYAFFAMAACAAIFCVVNAIQYALDPAPLFVAHGRLNGTTGNAQHAGALLGGTLPAVLYFVATGRALIRVPAVVLAIACLALLVWTGSRTGLAMGLLSTLFVLRSSGTLRTYAVLVGVVVLAAGLPALFDAHLIERFNPSSIEDTRSAAWSGMWQGFYENPIFGVEIEGGRLGFGESSWLAMASSAGIIGLIPLVAFGIGLVSLCLTLLNRPYASQRDRVRRDATVGCIASLLLGSFAEAYFLGTLNAPVYLAVLAGIIGKRMLIPVPWPPQGQQVAPLRSAIADLRQ